MTDHPPVLHGITLSPQKPSKGTKKPSANWAYSARLSPEMASLVDAAARASNARPSDILRSALAMFFAATPKVDRPQTILSDQSLQTPNVIAPKRAQEYRGSGGSDYKAIKKLSSNSPANRLRYASEKLIDKAVVR